LNEVTKEFRIKGTRLAEGFNSY